MKWSINRQAIDHDLRNGVQKLFLDHSELNVLEIKTFILTDDQWYHNRVYNLKINDLTFHEGIDFDTHSGGDFSDDILYQFYKRIDKEERQTFFKLSHDLCQCLIIYAPEKFNQEKCLFSFWKTINEIFHQFTSKVYWKKKPNWYDPSLNSFFNSLEGISNKSSLNKGSGIIKLIFIEQLCKDFLKITSINKGLEFIYNNDKEKYFEQMQKFIAPRFYNKVTTFPELHIYPKILDVISGVFDGHYKNHPIIYSMDKISWEVVLPSFQATREGIHIQHH